jgi:hypothetical protein
VERLTERIPSLRELFGLPTVEQKVAEASAAGRATIIEMMADPIFNTLPDDIRQQCERTLASLDELDAALEDNDG